MSRANPVSITLQDSPVPGRTAYDLFVETMGIEWPITAERFDRITCRQVLLAHSEQKPVGCALVDIAESRGYVQLIAVLPSWQGRGIGTALLEEAEHWLLQQGTTEIHLGAGGRYLWQGVPDGCHPWFIRRGYVDRETNLDMSVDLHMYPYPERVDRKLPDGMTFRTARPDDREDLIAVLNDEDLSDWKQDYLSLIDAGRCTDILLAVHNGEIIGAVMGLVDETVWKDCFPGPVGELACLGVLSRYRGKGVGLALAARLTLRLKELGMTTGYLKWTWLESWYGTLGYQTWRRFHMMEKSGE